MFLGIYKSVRSFRHESRFETWLYGIATMIYLKHLRKGATAKRAGVTVSHDESASTQWEPSDKDRQVERLILGEQRRAMQRAINTLPTQMRRCVTFRVYHEMSYRDIAEVMQLSIETVKAHLFQARARLKRELGAPEVDR